MTRVVVTDALRKRVYDLMVDRGWSVPNLAREANVAVATLRSFLSGAREGARCSTVNKISRCLEIGSLEMDRLLNCHLLAISASVEVNVELSGVNFSLEEKFSLERCNFLPESMERARVLAMRYSEMGFVIDRVSVVCGND